MGEYKTDRFNDRFIGGCLSDIRGRPNTEGLEEIVEKVKGIKSTFILESGEELILALKRKLDNKK
ncbi:MAG: hypothetical protein ACE5R6_05100 [Candidatus Heimdallarchaeota archaeon]